MDGATAQVGDADHDLEAGMGDAGSTEADVTASGGVAAKANTFVPSSQPERDHNRTSGSDRSNGG